ncbi:MAG: thioredoxin domain-containing protein [Betaproteobacteria bacterium]|nr:thioredoxin domain-containing protein [Betaproteobacteria bacterium]
MNKKLLFAGAAIVLVAAFIGGALLYKSESAQQTSQVLERNQANLVKSHSPTLGNPNAKVHIVEFLDPACGTCAAFYPHVKQIMAANPDKIRLSVRHVPFHKGADYVVKVLEATRKQGKYWQALEALLASQDTWTRDHTVLPEMIWKPLEGLGLNFEQIAIDMTAPEIAQRIEQDLADAKALNVTKTPEYFVNGQPLPSFGLEPLRQLVKDELARAY